MDKTKISRVLNGLIAILTTPFFLGLWFILLIFSQGLPVLLVATIGLGLSGFLVFLIRKEKPILLIPLILSVFIVAAFGIFIVVLDYGENYCSRVGNRVRNSSKEIMVPVNEEEKKKGYSEMIDVGWRAHMECHKNFSPLVALKNDFTSFLLAIPNAP